MKIGIVTIQKSPSSYGGNLQSYALWKYLSNLGHDVEIIDLYRPAQIGYVDSTKKLSTHTYKFDKKHLANKVHFSLMDPRTWMRAIKRKRFFKRMLEFAKLAKYSKAFYSVDSLYSNPPSYDVYVSGSDQIWNPNMNFELAPYFLDFVKDGCKVSYASSFGVGNISDKYAKAIKRWLETYKFVGVREESAVEILQHMGIKAHLVLDPTFLLPQKDWYELAKFKKGKRKNVFVFMLYHSSNVLEQVYTLARNNNYQVVSNKKYKNFHCVSACNVSEWLGYIFSSDLVITDSFHATAFSLIFRKSFYSIIIDTEISKKRATRLLCLLESLNIKDRCINECDLHNLSLKSMIDYRKLSPLLSEKIEASKAYLKEAIKNGKV